MKHFNSVVLLGLLSAIVALGDRSVSGAELVLVDHGVSLAPIIVFQDAPPRTRAAAVTLADYIEKITGARPDVLDGTPQPVPEHALWNGKSYNEGWLGATSSFTSILGREASYSGQVVKWDELAAKGPDLFPEEEPTWEPQPPVLPDKKGRYDHAVAMPGIYRPY